MGGPIIVRATFRLEKEELGACVEGDRETLQQTFLTLFRLFHCLPWADGNLMEVAAWQNRLVAELPN